MVVATSGNQKPEAVDIINANGVLINPATEEKQDSIIAGIATTSDIEGGGKNSVGTTAIEITFAGTTKSIIISADTSNTGTLYVGKSNINSSGNNAIAFLEAGETLVLEYDDSSNPIYIISSIAAQNFWKGALLS